MRKDPVPDAVQEIRDRRTHTRRKEEGTYTMRAVREREGNMGQVCIYCGHRKPITEFHLRNICRLCEQEAKEKSRGAR